ncbi:MAG: histidine phosphatase family protein [Methylococcaceae bacterium]|nr:histidine phosphatase family protein [Methylococcaceae bacterium]
MNTKSLLLLRHAKSVQDIEVDDWLRPLKKKGIQAAKTMGHWMLEQQLQPDLIISSPAKRTMCTAKKVCKAMGLDTSIIQQDERVYNATVELLTQVLQECPATAKRVLLVGHNPALEDLLIELVQQPMDLPDDGKIMPTAALAQLQYTGAWSKLASHKATLVALTRVKTLLH